MRIIFALFYFYLNYLPTSYIENEIFQEKLNVFIEEIKELNHENLLDGEVLIAKGDRILFEAKSQDISFDQPQFMIGSLSKQFFAVALLQLLYQSSPAIDEEEKTQDVIDLLHQPICYFLPSDASIWSGNMPEWATTVSLHHLLTHTSGIVNFTDLEDFTTCPCFESPHTKAEIIQLISDNSLLFLPGSQFSYSNTGYVLVAEIIERIAQTNASDYIEQTLFDAVGLTSTFNPSQGLSTQLYLDHKYSRLAPERLYDLSGDRKEIYAPSHYEDISLAMGSGSIIATARDLLKWNLALHKTQSILPASLYNLFITPYLDGYGYGIGIENYTCGSLLEHQGLNGTHRTALFYLPDHDVSIIILSYVKEDWSKVEAEFEYLFSELQQEGYDELECDEKAADLILQKYSPRRGFKHVVELLRELIV